jgi:thiamine-phosphate pyrophosphorylase
VTDDAVLGEPAFLRRAVEVLDAGGPAVALQLRGPRASGRALFALAGALHGPARRAGAMLLVNDRVDVALAAGADGVQLGARGLSSADARRLLGPGRWVGRSLAAAQGAVSEDAAGADFLVLGTVFASASHPGRPGAGLAAVKSAAAGALPVIAIGGMTPARAGEVRAAGGHGVAVLSAIWAAKQPALEVIAFVEELHRAEP